MYQLQNDQNMQNDHKKIYQQQQRYGEQWDALPPQSSSLWRRYRSQHPSFQLGYCGCVVTFAVIFLALCSFGTIIGTIPQVTAHQRNIATPTLTTALPMTVAKPTQQIHITASPTPKLVRPTPTPIRPRPTPPVRPKPKKH